MTPELLSGNSFETKTLNKLLAYKNEFIRSCIMYAFLHCKTKNNFEGALIPAMVFMANFRDNLCCGFEFAGESVRSLCEITKNDI